MIVDYIVTDLQDLKILTLDKIKNSLRVSHNYDDHLIEELMATAIIAAENFIGISLYTRTILAKIQNVSQDLILKYSNILTLQSVKHTADKQDITNHYGKFLSTKHQICFDTKYVGQYIEIEYVAGYKENTIPQPIQQGIIMHVMLMYDNSENSIYLNSSIKNLYLPYREVKI